LIANGLCLADALELTLGESIEYIKLKRTEFDAKYMADWERTRWLGATLLQPHAKKGKQIKPTDLMKFSWEKATPEQLERKTVSEQDIAKLFAGFIEPTP
jgi:hypothetical protein